MSDESNVRQAEREAQELISSVATLGRPLYPDETKVVRRRAAELRETISAAHLADVAARRPEVLTHGRPSATIAIRKAQTEARTRLEATKGCSRCPAAQTSRSEGQVVVFCGVERGTVDSRTDPQSLLTFCLGDYTACPSWRAEKERERLGIVRPLVSDAEAR